MTDPNQMIIDKRITEGIERWMEREGYLEAQTLDQFAEELNVSRIQLSDYCSRVIRKDMRTWRKEFRIKAAKSIMFQTPDVSLSTLSCITGFYDTSNFRRSFYECTGMYPNEWREKYCK